MKYRGLNWRRVEAPDPSAMRRTTKERAFALFIEPSMAREAKRTAWLFRRRPQRNCKSGHPGVHWSESKQAWVSRLGRGGKYHNRQFKTREEAVSDNRAARLVLGIPLPPADSDDEGWIDLPKFVWFDRRAWGPAKFVAEVTHNGVRWRKSFHSLERAQHAVINYCRKIGKAL